MFNTRVGTDIYQYFNEIPVSEAQQMRLAMEASLEEEAIRRSQRTAKSDELLRAIQLSLEEAEEKPLENTSAASTTTAPMRIYPIYTFWGHSKNARNNKVASEEAIYNSKIFESIGGL